ncbi:related to aspartate aminotransferase, cytoplasmic [Fusarium fujikuroi]|nr:related to aspartate aminotransferase, cytoplasmic [Fusarium fujikuroi]
MFSSFRKGPDDPMYFLKRVADQDTSPDKVDLGVGIYRNESGLYGQLGSVAKSASAQTISGTGACHLAALALSQSISPRPQVFVGTPTWGNYKPMFELVGLKVIEYPYFDFQTRTIDFSSIITAALNVPPRSVFILQACCHNPTGADPTRDQWKELGAVLARKSHFVLFDIAYHGLGNGLDEDAYAIRHFATLGLDMFVCQSFSKNFALYGERCGALHALCYDAFIPHFKPEVFVLKYLGTVIFVFNFVWWKVSKKTTWWSASDVDLSTERREWEEMERPEEVHWEGGLWKNVLRKFKP